MLRFVDSVLIVKRTAGACFLNITLCYFVLKHIAASAVASRCFGGFDIRLLG